MLALLQRVNYATVVVNNELLSKIAQGLLVFLAIEQGDTTKKAEQLLKRILGYRIFADEKGKMNLNVGEIQGELLIVPQFTVAADTSKGQRPSFTPLAAPAEGEQLFQYFIAQAQKLFPATQSGKFGAAMQVSLCNAGPVTFILRP